jgi:hypothetical protein
MFIAQVSSLMSRYVRAECLLRYYGAQEMSTRIAINIWLLRNRSVFGANETRILW